MSPSSGQPGYFAEEPTLSMPTNLQKQCPSVSNTPILYAISSIHLASLSAVGNNAGGLAHMNQALVDTGQTALAAGLT
jgi:hypothetical protein